MAIQLWTGRNWLSCPWNQQQQILCDVPTDLVGGRISHRNTDCCAYHQNRSGTSRFRQSPYREINPHSCSDCMPLLSLLDTCSGMDGNVIWQIDLLSPKMVHIHRCGNGRYKQRTKLFHLLQNNAKIQLNVQRIDRICCQSAITTWRKQHRGYFCLRSYFIVSNSIPENMTYHALLTLYQTLLTFNAMRCLKPNLMFTEFFTMIGLSLLEYAKR